MKPLFGLFLVLSSVANSSSGQLLESQLLREQATDLAQAARQQGDVTRGAIVFYQPHLLCTKCHSITEQESRLGPDLTQSNKELTDEGLVNAILKPSMDIRKGFETVTVHSSDGKSLTGLLAKESREAVILRDPARNGLEVTFRRSTLDAIEKSPLSIMPAGQVNSLSGRQQFLDLVRYLIEIRDGGPERARELEPAPSMYASRVLPEYESKIDHAAMIRESDDDAFKRGQEIYDRLCINCHGTVTTPGSLPTSLRFAEGKFKNGSDPYSMYQTLTRGFGMMVPQTWMVPQQKYDVIHYIREAYIKPHNPAQLKPATARYLATLPAGTERGPAPSTIVPWAQMDYGPNLIATYEIGDDGENFAYKGNAIRLDDGPGGVSQGHHWVVFDSDTMRVAGVWSGDKFIDWNGINFNGRHAIHPRIVGSVHLVNNSGPGWGRPEDGSFEDVRLRGRDNRHYGPLPRTWARYRGMYYHGNTTLIEYTVGSASVLESPRLDHVEHSSKDTKDRVPVFVRHLNIGPRTQDMTVQIAQPGAEHHIETLRDTKGNLVAVTTNDSDDNPLPQKLGFDGTTFLNVADADALEFATRDFTICATIRTRSDGTILAKTANKKEWVPDGTTIFVRGGRLCYDIGWVGVLTSRQKINDGKWHRIVLTYNASQKRGEFEIDGRRDNSKSFSPKKSLSNSVVRIGYTSSNFPNKSGFKGEISEVRFYQRVLKKNELLAWAQSKSIKTNQLKAHWNIAAKHGITGVKNEASDQHDAAVVRSTESAKITNRGPLVVGVSGDTAGMVCGLRDGAVRLKIPRGDMPLKFAIWTVQSQSADPHDVSQIVERVHIADSRRDLHELTKGGPKRWSQTVTSTATIGEDSGPFAVDVLTHPVDNPWFCRLRLSGFDFFADGDRLAVCDWDGNVWEVSGFGQLRKTTTVGKPSSSRTATLTWKRIVSGLFQPLGLKIVNGLIHVTCRDQLCVLHDQNDDGEIDYIQSLNNDHQVTDHFHEFAMGLQTDDEGNFYYAKSARHALPALVPHHGTLLKITPDGDQTEIIATGFRAANGVCINPDGSFIVTDQEGHWNPKNRINWVQPGGFYGNMFGYHDVTDSSDSAMEQPLCWITNAFDRSPAELLWVDSPRWKGLNGALLNFSYGYGKVYVVPHEKVGDQMQGGMCELPIPQFPTGVMRGRFNPHDQQLYVCGMFSWAGSQQENGGFYRIRATGESTHLPVTLNAHENGIRFQLDGPIDPRSAFDPKNFRVKMWSLKRTANYGSKHHDEKELIVESSQLASDGKTIELSIPSIRKTWCMEIRYSLKAKTGKPIRGVIHNTIHRLPKL